MRYVVFISGFCAVQLEVDKRCYRPCHSAIGDKDLQDEISIALYL